MENTAKVLGRAAIGITIVAVSAIICMSIYSFTASTTQIVSTHINSRTTIAESKQDTAQTRIEWDSRVKIERIKADGDEAVTLIEARDNVWYTIRWIAKMLVFLVVALVVLVEVKLQLENRRKVKADERTNREN